MKVAVTAWESRISPVADLTQELLVVDIGGQSITRRHHEHFDNDSLFYRAEKLDDLGVNTRYKYLFESVASGRLGDH